MSIGPFNAGRPRDVVARPPLNDRVEAISWRLHAERCEHMSGKRIGEVAQVDGHMVTLDGEGVIAAVRRGDVAVDRPRSCSASVNVCSPIPTFTRTSPSDLPTSNYSPSTCATSSAG